MHIRLMLLYGFGSNRALGVQYQELLCQDLSKLIASSSITEAAHSSNLDTFKSRILELPFHDRQMVVNNCTSVIGHQLDCVAELGIHCGVTLPVISIIEFMIQLCEAAACVSAILDIAENVS